MRALQNRQLANGVAAAYRYDMILAPLDHEAIAAEALAAMDGTRQIAPFSARYPGLSLDDAYRISARLCALRTARGERVIGRKIAFTDRTIWAEYGVYAAPPIGLPISQVSRSICCAMAPWSIAAIAPMCSTAPSLRCTISSACSRAIRSIRRLQPATSSPPAP
jgi:hypothetical protein